MKNSNLKHSNNWATPKDFYEALNSEFHFDFDPCPLRKGKITPKKDGLKIDWGKSNFINPPYSRKLKESFIRKAVEESENSVCVMLLPVSTSTKIFHDVILPNISEPIRFVRGRIAFEGVNTKGKKVTTKKGMHDSMIVIFGHNSKRN